jgi:hypothetical protein
MMDLNHEGLSFEEVVRRAKAERAVAIGEFIGGALQAITRALSSIRPVSSIRYALRALYDADRRRQDAAARIAIESWAGRY